MIAVLENNKSLLRKKALEKRVTFSHTLSTKIIHKILNSDDFKYSKHVALYMPIKNEIDITSLLKIKNKNFYIPKCVENELFFTKYIDENSLIKGKFNILESNSEIINPQILDIIYIPALMANKKCYRLGYGKGYYDRFFDKNDIRAKKVIVISSELVSDDFIEDEFDFRCDEIISA